MTKNKKQWVKKDTIFSIASWAGIIILLFIFINLKSGSIGNKECPDRIEGNVNATLLIKYFESPFCFYCWLEEPILTDLLSRRGNLFTLERYDVRYCHNETARYKVSGTPSFVFSLKNETKEYVHYGFIDKRKLEGVICEADGGC